MDEIMVRVMRTVACRARLRILTSVARAAETSPSQLAQELGMGIDLVSAHLARLVSAGLITRRRSGARVLCTGESPYPPNTFSGKVTTWLTDALRRRRRTLRDCGVTGLKGLEPTDPDPDLHAILMDAATAFANVRRIEILRRLSTGEVLTVEALSREMDMSVSAVSRQTSKLIRRGYLSSQRTGRFLKYRLSETAKTPLHARLWGIVRSEWQEG